MTQPFLDLAAYLQERQRLVETTLERLSPATSHLPRRLNEAMRYSLLAGGKRLRPILLLAACEAVGGDLEPALPCACALECIHTYSLIHDDLPAMDDDDLRRGRPTCHMQFDEATAILAGDGLLTLAFALLAEPTPGVDSATALSLVRELANAAGWCGMVGGQMLDLQAEGRAVELAELQNIHIHKTGALIRFACGAGARLGGGNDEAQRQLLRYGEAIGLAFQIMDDLLDEIGTAEEMGKATGADRKKGKATYVSLLGLSQARQEAEFLIDAALAQLDGLGAPAEPLRALARYIVARRQ